MAFACPRRATVCAAGAFAVVQLSGRVADDELAAPDKRELRTVSAVRRAAGLWHGLATSNGLTAGRVAHSASACDEPIASPGIGDNQPRGGLWRCDD